MFEKLLNDTSFWSGAGQLSDTVLSSRVRLIRNQADVPFASKQSESDAEKILGPVDEFIFNAKSAAALKKFSVENMNQLEARFLRERNILSEEAEKADAAQLVYRLFNRFSMIVNAEDHYRLQVIRPGLTVYECYGEVVEADDDLNAYVPYAFSERYGYLTSEIDNSGTGLKASVLMHLPVLSLMGTTKEVVRMVSEIGADMTPVTEHNSKNYGSFFIISNRDIIGRNETDLLEAVDDAARMVAGLESESRDDYYMNFAPQLDDRIWRAWGILSHARTISYIEALEHLSSIRLGIILSVIKNVTLGEINDLFVKIQPAHLVMMSGDTMNDVHSYDLMRADYLRNQLRGREVQSA